MSLPEILRGQSATRLFNPDSHRQNRAMSLCSSILISLCGRETFKVT